MLTLIHDFPNVDGVKDFAAAVLERTHHKHLFDPMTGRVTLARELRALLFEEGLKIDASGVVLHAGIGADRT